MIPFEESLSWYARGRTRAQPSEHCRPFDAARKEPVGEGSLRWFWRGLAGQST